MQSLKNIKEILIIGGTLFIPGCAPNNHAEKSAYAQM